MSLIRLWYEDGQEIDLSQYGLYGLRLIIPSPGYEKYSESVPGRPGIISLGKDLRPRELMAEFKIDAEDYIDSLLLRDELFTLFSKGNFFYVGETNQPDKRWSVVCTEQWTPERINTRTMTTSIPLLAESGMAESVLATIDPFLFAAQFKGSGTREIKYKHTTTTFEILNNGNVEVNPRYMPLLITFKGSSTNLKIRNLTTGDEWNLTGTTTASDIIRVDGIRSTKNSLSIFRNTNKQLITIAPGWNDFEILGTSGSFEITFDFHFYYL